MLTVVGINYHLTNIFNLCHTGMIFTTNSPKSTKSTKNPMARCIFQRNRYSWACAAKSPFALIDRAHLAEKSARKDEKTLFWPPPTSLAWLPNQQETKLC